MSKPMVRKTTYKGLSQADLATFAENVFTRMSTKTEYQAMSADITLLGQQVKTYKDALARAVNRGTDNVAMKEEIKFSLLQTLDRIADQLNVSHTGLESWVINAGMDIIRAKVTSKVDLDPPVNLQAISRGIRGELVLSFKLLEPKRVVNNGMEYSVDNGVSWQNGTYSTGTTIKVKGLPSRQSILFRVCSLGTFQRKSPWSETVEAFVM